MSSKFDLIKNFLCYYLPLPGSPIPLNGER